MSDGLSPLKIGAAGACRAGDSPELTAGGCRLACCGLCFLQVLRPDDNSSLGGEVDDIEIDTCVRDLPGERPQRPRAVFDLEDQHRPLRGHASPRSFKRLACLLDVLHQDMPDASTTNHESGD